MPNVPRAISKRSSSRLASPSASTAGAASSSAVAHGMARNPPTRRNMFKAHLRAVTPPSHRMLILRGGGHQIGEGWVYPTLHAPDARRRVADPCTFRSEARQFAAARRPRTLTAASRAPGRWHFLQLTLVMAAWMLLSPLVGHPWLAEAILQAFLLNSAVVTAWSNPHWQRYRWSLLALWGVSLGGSMLALAPLPDRWRLLALAAETVALVPLLVALATGILGYVFRCDRMTADSLFAPIVVYVLIALLFARVYVLLIAFDPSSFELPVAAVERGPDLL